MGVRIDGDLDFQHWYYENYNDVQSIVSNEIYHEYLVYKEQQKVRTILEITGILLIFCVIGQIVLILLKLKMI